MTNLNALKGVSPSAQVVLRKCAESPIQLDPIINHGVPDYMAAILQYPHEYLTYHQVSLLRNTSYVLATMAIDDPYVHEDGSESLLELYIATDIKLVFVERQVDEHEFVSWYINHQTLWDCLFNNKDITLTYVHDRELVEAV